MKVAQIWILAAAAAAIFSQGTVAQAERCISGYTMEGKPTRGSYGEDVVHPQDSFSYNWDEKSYSIDGTPDKNRGMFLYVPGLGDYVRSFDWSYCPESNKIVFKRRPVLTRRFQQYVYDGYTIWMMYANRE